MEGIKSPKNATHPRSPKPEEFQKVLNFLQSELRPDHPWKVEAEYPTALHPSNLHNMHIISDDEKVVSHAVVKPLIVKSPVLNLKVAAIGSVVTDPNHRGQGFSKQVIQECLASAKTQDCDIALLWTSLHDFYRKMDFELAGSELSFQISGPLLKTTPTLKFLEGNQISAESLHRLYHQHSTGAVRTVEDFKKFLTIPNTKIFSVWDNQNQLKAYAIEGKGADLTNHIHEWGGAVEDVISLFHFISTSKNSPYTVLAPRHAQNLVRRLRDLGLVPFEGFLGMIHLVQPELLFKKIKKAARATGLNDLILEKRGPEWIFGFPNDLIATSDPKTLIQILFGPWSELPHFKTATQDRLRKLFPLPLWIWGWDSV